MATKTITITIDAYDRLAAVKQRNESFSEVIARIVPRKNWRELIGTISPTDAKKLEIHIKDLRTEMDASIDNRWQNK